MISKALSLDDIAKIVSIDRDKKLYKDTGAFSCSEVREMGRSQQRRTRRKGPGDRKKK